MSFRKLAPEPPHMTIRLIDPTQVMTLHPRHSGAPGAAEVEICVNVAL